MAQGGYFYSELGGDEINTDVLVTYQTRLQEFDLSVSGGGNYMERNSRSIQTGTNDRNRGLVIPNLYRGSNIPIDARSTSNYSSQKKIYNIYGTASIGFMDLLYLDVKASS